MTKKTKTFDCVEMKNRIQQELQQEFQSCKTQFTSYADFINATADESEEIRVFQEKVAQAKASTSK